MTASPAAMTASPPTPHQHKHHNQNRAHHHRRHYHNRTTAAASTFTTIASTTTTTTTTSSTANTINELLRHLEFRPVQSPLHRPAYGSPRIIQTLVQKGQELCAWQQQPQQQRRGRALRGAPPPPPPSRCQPARVMVQKKHRHDVGGLDIDVDADVPMSDVQRQGHRSHISGSGSGPGSGSGSGSEAVATSPSRTTATEGAGAGRDEVAPPRTTRAKLSTTMGLGALLTPHSSQQQQQLSPSRRAPQSDLDRNKSSTGTASQVPAVAATSEATPETASSTPKTTQPQQPQPPPSARSAAISPSTSSPHKRRASASAEDRPGAAQNQHHPHPDRPSNPSQKRQRPEAALAKTVPQRYELCPVDDLVALIARMISELIETNDALVPTSSSLTRFHSRTAPGISVLDYLARLARHATLTPPLLLAMVFYIDRLCACYPEFTINTLTVHRFLIAAATVAAKGLLDSYWTNATYARVGGVRPAELKLLELEFLYRIDWRVVPAHEVLVQYYRALVARHPGFVLEAGGSGGSGGSVAADSDEEVQEAQPGPEAEAEAEAQPDADPDTAANPQTKVDDDAAAKP